MSPTKGLHTGHSGETHPHTVFTLAAHHFFHHLLGLFELADERVDILDGGAGAGGNALAAACVEDGRIPALLRGHGADDGSQRKKSASEYALPGYVTFSPIPV